MKNRTGRKTNLVKTADYKPLGSAGNSPGNGLPGRYLKVLKIFLFLYRLKLKSTIIHDLSALQSGFFSLADRQTLNSIFPSFCFSG